MIKLCSRAPAPPPFEYVKGGGGLFKDMAVHDLDMVRRKRNPPSRRRVLAKLCALADESHDNFI